MALMRTKPVEDVLAQNRDEPGAEGRVHGREAWRSRGEAARRRAGPAPQRLGPLDLIGFFMVG